MIRRSCVDLKAVRNEIGLGQSEFAGMIGFSPRTVQSCEQGWRNPSPAVEKAALLILMAHRHGAEFSEHSCWESVQCSERERKGCLVFKTRQGHLCWWLSGHMCKGIRLSSWEDKKKLCAECVHFHVLLPEGFPTR